MKPIRVGTISHPSIRVDYLDDWGPGMIDSVGAVPESVLAAIEPVLSRAGWELEDRIGQHSHDITVVNGAAFSHTDCDYGTVAIALVDYPLKAKTELITRHGGMEMRLGDVVIFDSDKWHAWIAHGPCALAALCVSPLPTTTTPEDLK